MFDAVWAFLKDPSNRGTVTWIGGGVVVAAGAVWPVVKFFFKKKEAGSKPSVRANNKGVAIGRDNLGPIDIDSHSSGKR